jgi:hypothetical protein
VPVEIDRTDAVGDGDVAFLGERGSAAVKYGA